MDSETFDEVLVPGPARGLAGVLGVDPTGIDDGWELPDLWHWVYLLERPAPADLGPEGHPVRGVPRAPSPGLRRMFAGGRVSTRRPLRLGIAARRRIEVVTAREREGRSGSLTIVTTRSTVEQDGAVCVVDEQDIIYRAPAALPTSATPSELGAHVARTSVPVDAATLFQFSALTYNAHRIHYDVDYCRDVEEYPGLVVHGPLQALLMAQKCRDRRDVTGQRNFSYRLVAPLTLGRGLTVAAADEVGDRGVRADVSDASGRVTATGVLSSGILAG